MLGRIVSEGVSLYNFRCFMPDEYLETKGELTGDLNPKKKKKKPHWWDVVIEVFMFGVIICLVVASANLLYLKCAYGSAFFVDGVSMYPALNGDALKLENDGSYSKINWNSGPQKEGDLVDYGWAKMGDATKLDLERFDIVITYFSEDMEENENGTYAAKSGASLKVKRLIGFPGETVQITPDLDQDTPYIGEGKNRRANLTTPWGTLTITSATGEVSVYPSYYTFDDYPDVNGVKYRDIITEDKQTYCRVLGENEYCVLGDNRASGFSDDCRKNENRVYGYCIQGKAYVITSLRKLKGDPETLFTPEFCLDKVRPFWNYTYLDSSPIANTKKEATSNA